MGRIPGYKCAVTTSSRDSLGYWVISKSVLGSVGRPHAEVFEANKRTERKESQLAFTRRDGPKPTPPEVTPWSANNNNILKQHTYADKYVMVLRRLPPCAKASRKEWAHTDPPPPGPRHAIATHIKMTTTQKHSTRNLTSSGLHRVADPSKPKQQTLQITNNQTTSILKQQTFKYLTKQTNVCARSACTACLCDCRFCNGREEHLQEEDTSTVQCDD